MTGPLRRQAGARQALRLFQPRQRDGKGPRDLRPGERRRRADLRILDRPSKDLGVTTVTMRNTGGTDHVSFDAVGLPGFQFIQDEIEYDTLTHHTNMDTVRAAAARRPDAGVRRDRLLRLRRCDARRPHAPQAASHPPPRTGRRPRPRRPPRRVRWRSPPAMPLRRPLPRANPAPSGRIDAAPTPTAPAVGKLGCPFERMTTR